MKKKIFWIASSLALVLVIAATSVALTIAALSASVNSTFQISYTAKNVYAKVLGTYFISNHEGPFDSGTNFATESGEKYIVFNKEDSESEKGFKSVNIDLGQDGDVFRDTIVIVFMIYNLDADNDLSLSMDIQGEYNNLKIEYEKMTGSTIDYASSFMGMHYETWTGSFGDPITVGFSGLTDPSQAAALTASLIFIDVRISIIDSTQNASLENGKIVFNLGVA